MTGCSAITPLVNQILLFFQHPIPIKSSSHVFTNSVTSNLRIFSRNFHFFLTEGSTFPQLPTQQKKILLFKLIHQYNIVTLSWNLNSRKKSSVYYWKLSFHATNFRKSPFSVIKWTFFPRVQILIFCCISLNSVLNFLAVLGVVDMCHLLLMVGKRPTYIKIREKFVKFANFCVSGLFQWWSSSTSNSRPSVSNSN